MKKIGKVEITTIFWNDWDIFLLLLFEPSPGAANDDISNQIILLLKHSHPGFNGLSCLVSGLQRSPSCIYLWGELACLKKIQHQHRGHLCMSIHQKWKYYRETDLAPLNLMWIIFNGFDHAGEAGRPNWRELHKQRKCPAGEKSSFLPQLHTFSPLVLCIRHTPKKFLAVALSDT